MGDTTVREIALERSSIGTANDRAEGISWRDASGGVLAAEMNTVGG